MKRSLILTLLIFVLSAAALCASHSVINAQKDAITITETVLYGDRAAAEGIEVLSSTHNGFHLFWDTSYTFEDELKVHTDFLFSQVKNYGEYNPVFLPSLSVSDYFDYSISGNNIILEDVYEQGVRRLPMKAVRDVAGRTPAGETLEEIIYLKDYYDYYPLFLDINFPRSVVTTPYNNLYDMTDYLKIPVSETQSLRLSVTKDSTGNITQVRSHKESGRLFLSVLSVFTDSGYYFYINAFDETGIVELPESVSGIHYIPFVKTEGSLMPSFEDIRLAYPLENELLYLLKSPDGSRLMLFANENDSITLSIIEAKTMSLLQKTVLFEDFEDLFLHRIEQYDHFFVAYLSDGRFRLLQEDENGSCEIKLRGNFYECSDIDENAFYNEMVMDYDGQRLAVVFYQLRHSCGTYLMVYDKDGLAYAGKYDHSADRYCIDHGLQTNSLSVSCG